MKSQTMLLLALTAVITCIALLVTPLTPLLAISDNTSFVTQKTVVGQQYARQGAAMIYFGGGEWQVLQAGKTGQFLRTHAETGAPQWVATGRMFKKSLSPTLGVSDTYGTVDNEFAPRTSFLSFTPNIITVTSTNVVAETVTAAIIGQYASGDNVTVTHAFTDNSTYTVTQAELITLYIDQTWLAEIQTKAKSSEATTSATITINVAGTEY